MWVCSQLLEAQADYHRKALAVLEKALPEMRAHQGNVTCVSAAASSHAAPSASVLVTPAPLHAFPWDEVSMPSMSQHNLIFLAAFSNFFQTQINTLTEHCTSNTFRSRDMASLLLPRV